MIKKFEEFMKSEAVQNINSSLPDLIKISKQVVLQLQTISNDFTDKDFDEFVQFADTIPVVKFLIQHSEIFF